MVDSRKKMGKFNFNLRSLRLSLRYRPEILKLILKMRRCIMDKNNMLAKLKSQLKQKESDMLAFNIQNTEEGEEKNVCTNSALNKSSSTQNLQHRSTQSDIEIQSVNNDTISKEQKTDDVPEDSGWKLDIENEAKSIAEQVKEVAQEAMQQSGMVYVESAGMYYDYKTGYYYNSELGLYYHTDTNCYYYYSDEKNTFVFHSYPDRSVTNAQALLAAREKKKAKKHKMERKAEDDIDNLTKTISQDGEENSNDAKKPKRKKNKKKSKEIESHKEKDDNTTNPSTETVEVSSKITNEENGEEVKMEVVEKPEELEDGECSGSDSEEEKSGSDNEEVKSNASTSTASDDESVTRSHPPCMRVIVRETSLPKLRVGSLFIVTKDGGTVGREGEQHTILLRDTNVSRIHLEITYDAAQKSYMATDLGSKNGSILNGTRMSESQIISEPMKVVHGSTLQLGETKLLCHIHPGNDTCGHCEPGLLMETLEKEKVAYTRTCNVKKQYELELARLKNKYGHKPMLAIEEKPYNDRAQARREAVGSSHSAEKTQASDIETSIAPDNKGFKLLTKMGWNKGEGLGKDSQGDTEPVPLISNEGKTGLGAIPAVNPSKTLGPATLRLATRTKMLKPPAKAFQSILDEEDSE